MYRRVYFKFFSSEVQKEIRKYKEAVTGHAWKWKWIWTAVNASAVAMLVGFNIPGVIWLFEGKPYGVLSCVSALVCGSIYTWLTWKHLSQIIRGNMRKHILEEHLEVMQNPLIKIAYQIETLREMLEPICKEWNDYVDFYEAGYDRDEEMEKIGMVLKKFEGLIDSMVKELDLLIRAQLKQNNPQETFVDLEDVRGRLEELDRQIRAMKETIVEMDGLRVPEGVAYRSLRIDEAVSSLTGRLSEAQRAGEEIKRMKAVAAAQHATHH
ncbi:MAG: hypothetical protein UU08_C0022G0020 [Candidatus Uhrbacteria bacterium GW2011_GWE2_40_58]|nr:MAG: hypothetical protein UT94_C0054G0001 [Candidatus Uhrbacteria bacterium GW2011_GWF2_40_263]KKR67269.1 MAG: hypothetical protein UU08_C0022G0020 [Candidatus Uhrbacteria bacterium GW2011_GWE2_40_58]OGL93039.1 MAG: hypothetical protein A2239_01015 [Candidatus Uhrbacteria bacterium RIFOXYA2_FULL_40_9]OGL97757.1 MAG: hypothetical protein A2332_02285 [Candidatus Uhrbacteria bacterium RIFOXYB2_FULL_41_18]HBK35134.1 hypothetical protein [Candidatus Uhrbacteria bacterium]